MAPSRHKAIVAGLALTLTLGTAAAPAVATMSNESPTTDTDPNGVGAPLPSNYDKNDFYAGNGGGTTFAMARSASRLSPVGLSDEMKYFAKYESSCNYDQGFSAGDGYNALGYYQFDRRYGLMDFIQQVYNHNPQKYAMFEGPLSNRKLLSNEDWDAYNYDSKQLKREAQELDAAWHAAYKADPAEFSALQDSYAYNTYYLPVQSILSNTYGVDIRNRADCVKGLVWGMCNLFGPGAAEYENGCRYFFKVAKISNDMTDRELVTALCDAVINNVAKRYPSQPQYHAGWKNRYVKEKAACLKYIAEDEAQAEANKPQPEPPAVERPQLPGNPGMGGPSAGEPGAGDPLPGDAPSHDAPSTSGPGAGDSDAGNSGAGNSGTNGSGADSGPDTPQFDKDETPSAGDSGSTGSNPDSPSTDTGADGDNAGGSDVDAGENTPQNDTSGKDPDAPSNNTNAPSGNEDSSNQTDEDEQGSTTDGKTEDTSGNESKDESTTDTQDDSNKKVEKDGPDADPDDTAGKNVMNRNAGNESKDGLPQTGDIGMLVMTGAAGLATAGASFVSLGKLEGKQRDAEDEE